ncbi:MAG: hypothetical protein LBB56_06905 [Chitinispirillales bacterium]|jgi:ribonuclease D|nr:hypothetical protein [Chitinispirillales bacterium]
MFSVTENCNQVQTQRKMVVDRVIVTEEELRRYLDNLRKKQIKKIALDMEGDQGSFRYKYSISIFQCFDGEEAVIIDVLRMGNNSTLREFLTCQDITKVMFSFSNDVFMAQNVLGCTIAPVNDIAVAQKLLGLPINITSYLNIDKNKKDSFQRANWLIRPIKPELMEYAINDVLKLLEIEEKFADELIEKELYTIYLNSTKSVSERNFVINQHCQYKAKFPGYMRMSYEKKRLAASVWIFRELFGEKLNCPVGYILSKKSMKAIINRVSNGNNLVPAIEIEINRGRKEKKRINRQAIQTLYDLAALSPHLPSPPPKRKRKHISNLQPVI